MAVVASVGGDPKPYGVIQAPILPPLTGTGSTLELIDMASLVILNIQRDNENRLEQITLRALLFHRRFLDASVLVVRSASERSID